MTTDEIAHDPNATPPLPPHHSPGGVKRTGAIFGRILAFPAASVTIATVVLVVVIGGLHPTFFKSTQILDILQQSVYISLLAIGLSYLIAMRDIDLSVGSVFVLSLIVGAIMMRDGWNPWIALLVMVAVGGLCGLANAAIVSFIRIPTIITTLATMSVFRGLAMASAGGNQVSWTVDLNNGFFSILGGKIQGFPIAFLIVIGIAIPVAVILHRTPFGYRVLGIGSNPEAAEFAGISIGRVRTQVLVLIGVLGGISGVLGLAYFTSGDPNNGSNFALQAIAAAVIGGTPLRGGIASVYGAIMGSILLNVVAAGLNYFGIKPNWSEFATGIVIIIAVGLDSMIRYRQGGSTKIGLGA